MIKNILYSIFLHLILSFVIYLNFNNIKSLTINDKEDFFVSAVINNDKKIKKDPTIKEIKKVIKKKKDPEKKVQKRKEKILPKIKKEAKKKIAKIKKIKKKEKKIEKIKKKEVKKPKKIAKELKKEKLKEINSYFMQKNAEFDLNKDIDNINLSNREKLNLKTQLKQCYIWAIKETRHKNNSKIKFTINISKNGEINSNIKDIIDNEKLKIDENYRKSVENIKKTLELCSPMRNLPRNKHEILQEINIEFSQ